MASIRNQIVTTLAELNSSCCSASSSSSSSSSTDVNVTADVIADDDDNQLLRRPSSGYLLSNKFHVIVTSLVLGTIILATIVGNVFVIAAIVLEKNLRNVANYLISSLAVADLMVAALVMPLAAVNEVSSQWFLGAEVCDMWISFDVLCCTSSILHLVAISMDRYWAVTRADYIHNRSSVRILVMVALSWGVSALITIPPLFRSRDPGHDPEDNSGLCLISQDWTYTVFSTIGAFYLPLIAMTIIYIKVYDAARRTIRKRQFRRGVRLSASASSSSSAAVTMNASNKVALPPSDETHLLLAAADLVPPTPNTTPSKKNDVVSSTRSTLTSISNSPVAAPQLRLHSCVTDGDAIVNSTGVCSETSSRVCILAADRVGGGGGPGGTSTPGRYRWDRLRHHLRRGINGSWISRSQDDASGGDTTDDDVSFADRKRRAKEKLEQKRERKAARTLAIVTGTFVVCWLPFFIVALVRPFCGDACRYPPLLVSVIAWLGYFNSLLNPIIYTIFNPDFRLAFRKILFGKYRRVQNRRIPMRLLRRLK